MKKKKIFFIVTLASLLFICFISYFELGKPITIHNFISEFTSQASSTEFTVIANTLFKSQTDDLSNEIIKRFVRNDFGNFYFSFDQIGYPSKFTANVYSNVLSYQMHKKAYSISAIKTSDNPIMYSYRVIDI